MEMEPHDAARFKEIILVNVGMDRLAARIQAQPVSHRIRMARLRAVLRDAEARLRELKAMVVKYENAT